MLYNLDWLRPGAVYPPESELERIQDANDNALLFDGDSYEVYKKPLREAGVQIDRTLAAYRSEFGRFVEINYYRLTALKVADLLVGEPPVIKVEDDDKQAELNEMLRRWGWTSMLAQGAIDLSRFGDAVFRVYATEDGSRCTLYNPATCYKVVDPFDEQRITAMVHCTLHNAGTRETPRWQLLAQIHEDGRYTTRTYALAERKAADVQNMTNGRILTGQKRFTIERLESEEETESGLEGLALFPLSQVKTSDRCWGRSDYDVIDPIMAEIWKRIGQISIILDKNAAPDMSAPASAFAPNERTGKWELKTDGALGGGNVWIQEEGQAAPAYVTWDGNLTAAFAELDMLFRELKTVTEMGAVYDASLGASNISTETMKATFVSPLSKVRRIANGIEDGVKAIIAAGCALDGIDIAPGDLSIEWCDGLPNDERREIENATMMLNAGMTTPEHELQYRFGLTQEAAERLAQEAADDKADRASAFGGFGLPGGMMQEDANENADTAEAAAEG